MAKLMTLNEMKDDSMIDEILNSEITVYEDIQGSKIYANWDGKSFTIKAKSLSSEPINMIDLAMQNYYNHAINYFNSLDSRVKGLLNRKWWFGFEFFPDNQPANIEYNRIPKNHLVLSSICKGNRFDFTFEELEEYSRLFEVDVIPVIFQGKLNDKSIEAIKYFLSTSEQDLEYVFGEKSFSYFFYKILNPQTQNSFLMDEDFQKNLEKLIIKVNGKDTNFEILNPLYKRISDSNSTDFVEIYSLILVNFMNFSQSVDMDQIKLKGHRRDECYLYLVSKLFNMYISEVKEDLQNFDFQVPQFFDKEKFRINTELIPNKLTKQYISEDKKFEYVFKCVLGSFNKFRKKPIGVFNEATIKLFNGFVKDIQDRIDSFLNKKSEVELTRNDLLSFGDYFNIVYDKDGDDQVYPDIFQEIEKNAEDKSKKKGFGKEDMGKFEK